MEEANRRINRVLTIFTSIFILILVLIIVVVGISHNSSDSKQSRQTPDEPSSYTRIETKKQSIPFDTTTVEDSELEYGKTMVKIEGVAGEKTLTYEVTYEDKKEVSRKLTKEEVTKQPITKVIANGTKIMWHCVDATSYNKNPYDDNRCTSSTGQVVYVSDSQSIQLDPSYSPGKSGHSWYNNK